jgi:hypothetical protein
MRAKQGVRAKTDEERIARRRVTFNKYMKTPSGMDARRRSEDKRLAKIRGPQGKVHRRRIMLRFRYGITHADYEQLLTKQGGHCALCDRTPEMEYYGKLAVDHDHVADRVRGLLCMQHNQALGKLGDTVESIRKVLEYLERSDVT